MDLYFDKENVAAFIEQNTHPLYDDCLRTMQRQLDVFFNFKKEELLQNESLLNWFRNFAEGTGVKSKQTFLSEKFPARPLKSNTYLAFNTKQLSSIYCIDDKKMEVLKRMGAILVGAPGEEIALFRQLFLLNEDYKFNKKMKIASPDLSCWDDLGKFSLTTSDILFFDPYIFSIPDFIEINLVPLLQNLVQKARCKVNIVFYVNQDHFQIAYADLSKLIRTAVNAITGKKPNLTIIKYLDQRGIDSLAEHDRTIFTNYCRYYSGDTFNYFKADGSKQTKGRELHLNSMAAIENHQLS
ncbi:MAG: hypothetical protein AAGJ18_11545, partial [Bacteroidota bacterium]